MPELTPLDLDFLLAMRARWEKARWRREMTFVPFDPPCLRCACIAKLHPNARCTRHVTSWMNERFSDGLQDGETWR